MSVTTRTGRLRAGLPITFTEREPYESGFKRIFDKQIAPKLAALEEERGRLKRDRAIRVTVALVVVAAVVGAAIWYGNEFIITVAAIVGLIGALIFVGSPTDKFRAKVRDLVMPVTTKFLDITYSRAVPAGFDIGAFRERNVVPAYDKSRSRLQDHVSGEHDGRRYAMIEANLQRRSGKSTVTVFQGVLMSIDWPEAGRAEVFIGRDRGKLLNKLAGITKPQRVTFDHPEFERVYEVYASDPAMARQLLVPAFLDCLVALNNSRKGYPPTAAFVSGRLLVALPLRGDLFEPGSLSRSLAGFEDEMHTLLRQLTIPRRIIDVLHGQRRQIL